MQPVQYPKRIQAYTNDLCYSSIMSRTLPTLPKHFILPILPILLLLLHSSGVVYASYEVKPLSKQQLTEYELEPQFYKKGTLAEGILIATSAKVSDFAHLEAAYQVSKMMKSLKPGFGEAIKKSKPLIILVGHNELTSDIPQFKSKKTGKELDFYNWRSRGFLTRVNKRPVILTAEEDVLEYEGGMQKESILIHEFAHLVHRPGFPEGFDEELLEIWKTTKASGLWNDGYASQRFRRIKSETPVLLLDALTKSFPEQPAAFLKKCLDSGDIIVNGKATNAAVKVNKDDKVRIVFGGPKLCYAMKNRAEYFAEMVQAWFNTNRTMDHDHNHIDTREELKAYDPKGYKYVSKIFKDEPWRFISPRKRAGQAHLKGYDPSKAPVVTDPDHIKKAANDYYDKYWADYWQRLREKHGVK